MEVEPVIVENGHADESNVELNGENSFVNGILLANGTVQLDDRVKRKFKKPLKPCGTKDFVRTKSDSRLLSGARSYKNARKSRSSYGRGLPKKGGGGGKGTWGKPGSELLEEVDEILDPNDPNYDEAADSRSIKLKVIDMEEPTEDIKKKLSTIVLEYYDHADTDEVMMSLEDLRWTKSYYLLVTTAIEVALEHKPSHRELTSVLLADVHGSLLDESDYATGYDELLKNLPDLILDTPDAPTVLGNFIARSIADECIPPKFLQGYKGKIECDHAVVALARAETLLSMRHGFVRLDNVWGVGGGARPVKLLVKKIFLLLEEYLSSDDMVEATRCLTELEVPHFHHELVYEAVLMALEKMGERASEKMCALLKSMYDAAIITPNQMKDGFLRIYQDMPQICLDVPLAYNILENFVLRCNRANIVGPEVVKRLPTRGRKRFVSEGDGGRVKDHY